MEVVMNNDFLKEDDEWMKKNMPDLWHWVHKNKGC